MKKRLLSIVLTLCMVLMLVPQAVFADGGVDYLYCDANGANWQTGTKQTGKYTVVTSSDTEWTTGWYVVQGDVTINSRVTVSGDVHLILADGCKLTVNGGIQVQDDDDNPNTPSKNALTIYSQAGGTGKLTAQKVGDSDLNAAIGGNGSGTNTGSGGDGGTITINGGIVEAKGDRGAGIGGGSSGTGGGTGNISDIIGGSSGTITINGGTITASSISGAGIGGGGCLGFYKDNGTITINGGTITASSNIGAGIGGGCHGSGGKITITGGIVTATSEDGAGIGSGDQDRGNGGEITITGGNVTAESTKGVGIGASRFFDTGNGSTSLDGSITIEDGTVTILGGNAQVDCYGILAYNVTVNGGSVKVESGRPPKTYVPTQSYGIFASNMTISGGSVKAKGGPDSISEGDSAPNYSYGIFASSMTISGNADVTATGGEASTSYGIYVAYTSDNANSGSMTVSSNAEVTAIGGEAGYSYGICVYKQLTITGGTVKAKGSDADYSQGLATYGSVTINGGSVEVRTGTANTSSLGIFVVDDVTITDGSHVTIHVPGNGTNGHAMNKSPKLPKTYWWRAADNDAFTASSTTEYAYKYSDTYVEITDHFTVTLNPNYADGESGTVTTGADGKLTEALPTPIRTGYTFDGWFTEAEGGTAVTNDTVFNGFVTIYAHWTAKTTIKTYTVKLNTNGGTINSGNITAYTCGQVTALPTDVTRAGYTFAGWYDNAAFMGSPVTAIGADATGEKAYWAKWVYTAVPDEIPYVPQAPQNGWKSLTAGSAYYKNGVKVKGLQQIDGETYYFDEKGYLQTGWVKLNGNWYYFDAAMQTGWVKDGNTWYYLDPRNGAMAEGGLMEIDGKTYYFHDWGGMASNFWYQDEKGDWYYFGGDGAMAESKWVLWNGAWYYLGSDGEMLAEKWLYWNGEWYYLGSDGAMLTNTTTPDGYYVGNDGVWVK